MSEEQKIRVVIADDQELVRAGFAMVIGSQPDMAVVGQARDGAEAVALAETLHPDVVLMDVRMPGVDGIEATRRISALQHRFAPDGSALDDAHTRVIILTTFDLDEYVMAAINAGASGFLLKDTMVSDKGVFTSAALNGNNYPVSVDVAFQVAFAMITVGLICGAIAERVKYSTWMIFVALWITFDYAPLAHMVWGQGGLLGADGIGALDFAGGDVVHISSGVSALVLCILLGKRHDYEHSIYRIHNIPTVVLGASLLMFGWFGFNAGSALAADGLAAHAFMTTGVSAAAAMLSWMLCDVIKNKKPTLIGASTGMVAGLVGITPGAGFVPMWAAVIIGLTTSPVCYIMISYGKKKFGFDDALDAFSCHGTGGIWGGLLTGVFSCTAINSSAGNGLVYGEFAQFGAQAAGIGITIVIAVVGTLICYGITRLLTGKIRVDLRDELMGLDVSQHGESAYPSFNGLDN